MLLLSYHLRGGRFECKDLDIKDDYWGWMVLGQDLGGEELYTVEQTGTITILRGNGNAYAFYAETFQGSGEPGVINDITVDPGATGDFTLLIDHPDA
ncbi:MAG: hypothetical protein ACE5I3_15995, partial [Phycisphaerae bacterium]